MKVFAILTAALMTAGGAAYLLEDSSPTCPYAACSPVAKTGACCSPIAEKPSCCSVPCPECAADCLDCCALCEQCCTAGVQAPVAAKAATSSDCCALGSECCLVVVACCAGAEVAIKPPAACDSPAGLNAVPVTSGSCRK